MVTKTVKLGVLTDGVDKAVSDMTKLGESKDKLSGDATIKAVVKDVDVSAAKIAWLKTDIDALTKRTATFTVDGDDKLAKAKLLDIGVRLTRLGTQVAKPGIDPKIVESGFLKTSAALDELAKNRTVHVKVDTNQSALSKAKSLFGMFSGGGGGGGAASGASSAASGGGTLLSNPYVLSSLIGVGALVAPSAGQAVAGSTTLGFGALLAGMGVAGAFGLGASTTPAQLSTAQSKAQIAQLRLLTAQQANAKKSTPSSQASLLSAQNAAAAAQANVKTAQNDLLTPGQIQVRKTFKTLSDDAQGSLTQIGKSFVPVMQSILTTADSALGKLTPVFTAATRTISGPFKIFSDTLIKVFASPAVTASIGAVAKSFGLLLTALTPGLAGDTAQVADGISRLVRSVSDHPQAFTDLVQGMFKFIGILLDGISALANFGGYLQEHFWPAMHRTSVIFDGVRHDTAHIWDQIYENSIGVMTRLGHNIETQFNSVRHETAVIFDGVRGDLGKMWNNTYNETIGAATRIGHNVETQFNSLRHSTANIFDGLRHDTATAWNNTYGATIGVAIRIGHDVETQFNSLRHSAASIFDGIRHDIAHYWDVVWSDTISKISNGIAIAVSWFKRIPGNVRAAIGNVATYLAQKGIDLITGLYSGITSVLANARNWVQSHIFNPIVNAIKSLFGINSPSTVMANLGGHLVSGLILGLLKANPAGIVKKVFGSLPAALGSIVEKGLVSLTQLPAKALSALSGLGSKLLSALGLGGKGAAANVAGWLEAALAVTGKPLSWLDPLEILVGKESGGNPNAYNPISVGGEHATGLMQMLGSTFAANMLPGFGNILNPLDNAISSIRYISAQYGSPMNIPGLTGGNYVGYDQGGVLMPGFHLVANLSGKPEQVIPAGGLGGGTTVNIYCHPSNNPDEVYEQVWQGLRNLRRHKGNQPLGLG